MVLLKFRFKRRRAPDSRAEVCLASCSGERVRAAPMIDVYADARLSMS